MLVVAVLAASILACGSGTLTVTPLTFTFPASGVTTFVMRGGLLDSNPGHNCDVAVPPAPTPAAPSATLADDVVVGYDNWRNTNDSCQNSNAFIYRGAVTLDVSSIASKKNLLSSATLQFDALSTTSFDTISPATTTPSTTTLCAGQLLFVSGTWTPTSPGATTSLNHFTQAFPNAGTVGTSLYTMPAAIPATSLTTGDVQITSAGRITVNVLPYVQQWIDHGVTNNGLMFTASFERFPENPFSSTAECLTHFANIKLTVNTL